MKIWILSCLLVLGSFDAEAISRPSHIKSKVWDQVEPYLIPDDHPAKIKLDEIFQRSRATICIKSMEKAGFINPIPQPFTHIVVTKHPELPGFIIKAYLDAQRDYKNRPEQQYYLWRIWGARKIQAMLDEKGWNDHFKVPKKWIYVLPDDPLPPGELIRRNFILVEDDMDIYSSSMNAKMWRSDLITSEVLDQFYYILEEIGLSDCAKPKNSPISQDGKIAFVDTQTHNSWPVSYHNMDSFLSPEMRAYWKKLTR